MRSDIGFQASAKLKRHANHLALLLILFLSFLLHCGSAAAAESSSANLPDFIWWDHVEFFPTGKAIRGIPLSQIDPSWKFASELKKPRKVIAHIGRDIMKEYGIAFSRQGDFNKDGREDLVTVGVYENKKGNRGSFILVLSKDSKSRWRKVSVIASLEKPHFQAVAEKNGKIEIWGCIDCDWVNWLVWDKKSKSYSLEKPLEEGNEDKK
ncbi:MAG: hypothetical protein M0009_08885 [Deltaproteobacteria bacterium]|nr:hypothetical protein [Deltaproteobacteria bacterium]